MPDTFEEIMAEIEQILQDDLDDIQARRDERALAARFYRLDHARDLRKHTARNYK